ncbi:hypothetical protein [Janthinobacterium sp. PSPC2-1]|uniref:hypothetical protein n=1 Tax=unclassified Janthinobacterium TaxID=2610881 RepID=UPI003CE9F558
MPAAPTPLTRLIAPRTALASCVRAILVRDTTRCAPLPPAQRLNRFPAAPMCSIIWTVAGDVEAAAPGLSLPACACRPRCSAAPVRIRWSATTPAPCIRLS